MDGYDNKTLDQLQQIALYKYGKNIPAELKLGGAIEWLRTEDALTATKITTQLEGKPLITSPDKTIIPVPPINPTTPRTQGVATIIPTLLPINPATPRTQGGATIIPTLPGEDDLPKGLEGLPTIVPQIPTIPTLIIPQLTTFQTFAPVKYYLNDENTLRALHGDPYLEWETDLSILDDIRNQQNTEPINQNATFQRKILHPDYRVPTQRLTQLPIIPTLLTTGQNIPIIPIIPTLPNIPTLQQTPQTILNIPVLQPTTQGIPTLQPLLPKPAATPILQPTSPQIITMQAVPTINPELIKPTNIPQTIIMTDINPENLFVVNEKETIAPIIPQTMQQVPRPFVAQTNIQPTIAPIVIPQPLTTTIKPITSPRQITVPLPIQPTIPLPIQPTVPRPVAFPAQTTVPLPIQTTVPLPVQTTIPLPVQTPITFPAQTTIPRPVPLPVQTTVALPVQTTVPLPVQTTIPRPVALPVQTTIPRPVALPVQTTVPLPVQTTIPRPVTFQVQTTVPQPVAFPVQTTVPRPVALPVQTTIPLPVQNIPRPQTIILQTAQTVVPTPPLTGLAIKQQVPKPVTLNVLPIKPRSPGIVGNITPAPPIVQQYPISPGFQTGAQIGGFTTIKATTLTPTIPNIGRQYPTGEVYPPLTTPPAYVNPPTVKFPTFNTAVTPVAVPIRRPLPLPAIEERAKVPLIPGTTENTMAVLNEIDPELLIGERAGKNKKGYKLVKLQEFAQRLGLTVSGKQKQKLIDDIQEVRRQEGIL